MYFVRVYSLQRSQFLPIPVDRAWDFFSLPENLRTITPRWMNIIIRSKTGNRMFIGQVITYRLTVLPLVRLTWVTEITDVSKPFRFTDEQRSGPYTLWRHTHYFHEVLGGVQMKDEIIYALPMGLLGRIAHWLFVARAVRRIFDYRFRVLEGHFKKA